MPETTKTVDLPANFDVEIVGTLPPGLPRPTIPRLDKLASMEQVVQMADVALVAALISFIVTHSIAKSLAGPKEVRFGMKQSMMHNVNADISELLG